MKVSSIQIYTDWCRIKHEVPSYRLGQHYCNVLGLEDTMVDGVDLFNVKSTTLSDILFEKLVTVNQWDRFDLPIFGDYDISSIRPK
ncbi:hypothetical protein [Vibrio phage RYC]|nr:hypothetical protein [Vibrio phage RYC]